MSLVIHARAHALLTVLLAVLFATSLGVALPAARQAQASPTDAPLTRARALVSRGENEAAEVVLEELVRAEPENPQAWYLLGLARHAQGKYAQAMSAHDQAAGFPATKANALYNAACAHSRRKQLDEGFADLTAAMAAGFSNPGLLGTDPDLTNLRGDARFARFQPEGLGAPVRFLEPDVRILHEWRGEAAGDQFGWEGRNVGDADGDGVDDALISAPYKSVGGPNAGRIYVYSGKDGRELFRRTGAPGELLGIGIAAAGDVNGDGHDDAFAGAQGSGTAAGKAYVFSGLDGETLLELTAEEPGDRFGWKVAPAGDVDRDGHADLLVGAPQAASGAGRAYLFSGKDGAMLLCLTGERAGDGFGGCVAGHAGGEEALIAVGAGNAGEGNRGRATVYAFVGAVAEPRFSVRPEASGVNLGRMFLSFPGDVNGDGTVDFYVSDWEDGAGGPQTGRIYVHSGKNGERLHDLAGESPGEGFGIGTAEAGDVDGDGCDDLVIGAWQNAAGAASGGRVSVFSGRDAALLRVYTCTNPGDTFGFDATTLGDVDGDGANDFLITAAYSPVNGFQSGRSLVVAGPRIARAQAPSSPASAAPSAGGAGQGGSRGD